MNRLLHFSSILLLLMLPSALIAAEPAGRTFRIFTVIGHASDLKFDQRKNRDSVSLSIYSNPSQEYAVPLGSELVLYREVPAPPDSPPGTPPIIKQPVVTIPVVGVGNRLLIALAPIAGGRFAAQVIEDDPEKHPVDTIKIINMSALPAAIAFNEVSAQQINPGASGLMPLPKGAALVQLAVQKGSRWVSVLSEERRFTAGCRFDCLIFNYAPDPDGYNSPEPAPVLVRMFAERVPAN